MMREKRQELNESVDLLMRHQLWRRGKTDRLTADQSEIGQAIDCVCGGVLDYLELTKDFDKVCAAKNELLKKVQEQEAELQKIQVIKNERNHLKAVLAGLRIPHKMNKKR